MNHGLDLEERLENLVITGACLSSNEERVVLYVAIVAWNACSSSSAPRNRTLLVINERLLISLMKITLTDVYIAGRNDIDVHQNCANYFS